MKLIQHINTLMDSVKKPKKLKPKGIMWHSTATKGVDAKTFADRWNRAGLGKSVHAFVDWFGNVYQIMPWEYCAGHCAGRANYTHIAHEACEPPAEHWADPAYCMPIWNACLDLDEMLCRKFGLTEKDIIGHYEGHRLGLASNHADPGHWLPKWGKSMGQYRLELAQRLRPAPTEKHYVVKAGDSLSKIGKQFGIPWKNIADLNGIKPTVINGVAQWIIRPGQELVISK